MSKVVPITPTRRARQAEAIMELAIEIRNLDTRIAEIERARLALKPLRLQRTRAQLFLDDLISRKKEHGT